MIIITQWGSPWGKWIKNKIPVEIKMSKSDLQFCSSAGIAVAALLNDALPKYETENGL